MKKPDKPRNVKSYHIQTETKTENGTLVPDGCHNCQNRYYGMVDLSNTPIVSCKKACLFPKEPSFCDRVDPLGKCKSFKLKTSKKE
jgi:hypothetical protein